MEINKVYKKDYLDMLNSLPDNSCDLICIDPPYNIDYKNDQFNDSIQIDWDLVFEQSDRILKPTGNLIIFTGWSNLYNVEHGCLSTGFSGFWPMNQIIWDRQKTKNGGKKNFTSAREDILWYVKSSNYTFNKEDSLIKKKTKGFGSKNGSQYRRLSNVWTDLSPIMYTMKEYNGYPTQKPLQLMRRIIRIFSNPDDVVLDCFCGSGSTLEAAQLEGRNFIGSDINDEAIKISKGRVE